MFKARGSESFKMWPLVAIIVCCGIFGVLSVGSTIHRLFYANSAAYSYGNVPASSIPGEQVFGFRDLDGTLHNPNPEHVLVPLSLLSQALDSLGVGIIVNHEENYFRLEGRSFDPRIITERVLWGNWINLSTDGIDSYGFQFGHSIPFGPYTFTRLGFESEGVDAREIVFLGFYEVTNEGNLRLHYREERFMDMEESDHPTPLAITQDWNIEFIGQNLLRMINGDVELILHRVGM